MEFKSRQLDEQISKFVDRYGKIIFIFVISVLALVIRKSFLSIQSSDMSAFLLQWTSYLKEHGGFLGIRSVESDYNVPYLYLLAFITYLPFNHMTSIKLISILFDFIGAVGSCLLINEIIKKNNNIHNIYKVLMYSLVLFSPTVILNGSAWGQCDMIYTSFIIYSIYFFEKGNDKVSIAFWAIAFAFKLQAVFLLPVYFILYFCNKRFSLFNFFLIPIVNIVIALPALLVGRPIKTMLRVYYGQATQYPELVYNFPNIYNLVPDLPILKRVGIVITIAIIGIIAMNLYYKKVKLDSTLIIELSLLMVIIVTYFLPSMHDRYMFLADILSLFYCIIKKNVYVPVVISMMSLNCYFRFLFGYEMLDMRMASIIQLCIALFIIKEFIKDVEVRNKEE